MERLVLSLPLEGLQRYDCQASWAYMRGEIYMREWEKMLAGELYDPADHELKAGREAARTILFELQQLPPDAKEQRQQLWRQLLGSAKGSPAIHLPFHCDYGRNIHLGERFYANAGCTILDVATVTIGDDVLLAPGVQLITATHPTDSATRLRGLEYGQPITLGDKCWLGAGVIVCPGVTIGEGAVIGAGSVVTRDIPPYSVAVGNPCRVIRSTS